MNIKQRPTFWAKIYMAGDIDQAKHLLRAECMRNGLCVTVEPATYIYTGGEESGFVVGLVDYPRFPSSKNKISARAEHIAQLLINGLFQSSALVQTPTTAKWFTNRSV